MTARRLRPHANEFELQTPTRHERFATTRRILEAVKDAFGADIDYAMLVKGTDLHRNGGAATARRNLLAR